MTSSKHEKSEESAIDLKRNPDIGQSKGAFATGSSPKTIEGENTTEGDVENDTLPSGGVSVGTFAPVFNISGAQDVEAVKRAVYGDLNDAWERAVSGGLRAA